MNKKTEGKGCRDAAKSLEKEPFIHSGGNTHPSCHSSGQEL